MRPSVCALQSRDPSSCQIWQTVDSDTQKYLRKINFWVYLFFAYLGLEQNAGHWLLIYERRSGDLRCTADKVYKVQRCCWIDLNNFAEPSNHQCWNCWDVDKELDSRKGSAEEQPWTFFLHHCCSLRKVSILLLLSVRACRITACREAGMSSNPQQGRKPTCSNLTYFILGLRTTVSATLEKSLELGSEVWSFLFSRLSLLEPARDEVFSWALINTKAQGSKGGWLGRKATANTAILDLQLIAT